MDEDEINELRKGKILEKQEALKGKVEKAKNFEMLQIKRQETGGPKGGGKAGNKT